MKKYLLILSIAAASAVNAATITWNTPQNITGDSDVSTAGSLVQASNVSGDTTTVNGVTFTPFLTAGSATSGVFTLVGAYGDYSGYLSGNGPFTPEYAALLTTGNFGSNNSVMTLTINSLNVGTQYQFQVWINDSRGFYLQQPVNARAGNNVRILGNVSGSAGGTGQYAIGTFVADATTQTIEFQGEAGTGTVENAFMLRDLTGGPVPPPHGGLSSTVFTINGSANPGSNLTDTALHFSARQSGTPDGLIVRVQMNSAPDNNLTDWVNLPNGSGHGYMTIDKTTNQFVLTSTNYPSASVVYFRALSSAPGYPDSKSNIIGPFDLTYGKGHLSHTTLYGAANGPGQEMNFRADVGVDQAAITLFIQSTTTPDDDASWVGLNDGRAGQMHEYASHTSFYLDTTKYPSGDPVYFRALATAPGFVPSYSNIVGIEDVVNGAPPTLDIVPPFPQPGSQSGLDASHPIIVAMGTLNMGATNIASPDNRPIAKVGLVYDGGTIETWSGGASSVTTQYLTNVPGDHVIKAYAIDDRGIRGYAQPVFVRIKPENGKSFNMVASGDWNSGANWRDENGQSGVPGANDMAFIGNVNASINGPVSAFIVTLAGGSITGGGNGTSLTITKNFTIDDGMLKNLNLTIGSEARMILVGDNPVPASGTVVNNGTVRITGRGGFVPVPSGANMNAESVVSPNGLFDGIGAFFKNVGTFIVNLPKTIATALTPPANPVPIPLKRGVYAAKFENAGSLLSENGLGLVTDNGSGLLSHDGSSLLSHDGSSLISQDGGSIIGPDGASAISHDGSSIISNDGASAPGGTTRPTTAESTAESPGFVQTGGELNLSGFSIESSIALNGGALTGSGIIAGSLTNSAGFVSPGHSAGSITVTGDFTQGEEGTLVIERGGKNIGENDQIQVSGTANLGGNLHVKTINGFAIDPADTFSPLGYSAVTGSFAATGGNAQVTLNANGAQISLNPGAPQPTSGQPLNIATRMSVLSGDNALIAGFIVTGPNGSTKKVMIRGLGPSLAQFGVPNTLSDPFLELHKSDGTVINDNWQQGDTSQIPNGFTPGDTRESVIVATLTPGSYSAVVKGAHGETGVGIAELYDLDSSSPAKLANISTRGFINSGDDVMIGGFIVGGSEPAKILVRAIGPTLTDFGVQGALADPTLELHDGNGMTITNDDWRETQEAEIAATTIPPNKDKEPAILATLAPGSYTAVVRGKNNTTGIGLVEAYNLQ